MKHLRCARRGTYVVDDHGDGLDVDATGEDVSGDEDLGFSGAELVDDTVTLGSF
jgi:hypothetical protein